MARSYIDPVRDVADQAVYMRAAERQIASLNRLTADCELYAVQRANDSACASVFELFTLWFLREAVFGQRQTFDIVVGGMREAPRELDRRIDAFEQRRTSCRR